MKLLIDLHDEVYNNMVVKNEYTEMDVIAVHNALIGAKRIPEGHGRLIDADELFERVGKIRSQNKVQYKDIGRFMNMITYSPTIIGADKGDI